MSNLYLIINPHAGGAVDAAGGLAALAEGDGAQVVITESEEQLLEVVNRLARDSRARLVVAGGDGTLSAAVGALMSATEGAAGADARAGLGVIPLGTANDLAGALGLDEAPEDAWFRCRDCSEPLRVDVLAVRVGERALWAINSVVSSPAVAEFEEHLDDRGKQWLGSASYGASALATAADLRSTRYRVQASREGVEVLCEEVEAFGVVIGNGETSAGGVPVGERGSLTSGTLDLMLLTETGLLELGATAARMLSGQPWTDHEHVRRVLADACTIEALTLPSPSRVDGESVGPGTLTLRCVPGALRVFC